ncbi:hypothetical protein [Undibacterium sp. Di24W]|uniref:hypothetical protein n=1 Tax=Undibacterium sp. Di24W TaxID=3413033 RepID=UPI003BEF991F
MNFVFRPHGRFKVWTEGQLLLTEVTGPWNRELIDYWAQQARDLVVVFSTERPYVAITTVYESILCPADAIERIEQAVQHSRTNLPCLANVIVVAKDVDGRDIVKRTYQRIGLEHIFEDFDSAKAWAEHILKGPQVSLA